MLKIAPNPIVSHNYRLFNTEKRGILLSVEWDKMLSTGKITSVYIELPTV